VCVVTTVAPDALAVSCARCLTPAGRSCRSPDAPARAPHPERVAAARLARDQQKRSESAWLELAEIWRDASEDDQRAILAVVKLRQAIAIAVDWEEYSKIFPKKAGETAMSLLPQGIPGSREGTPEGINPVTHRAVNGQPVRRLTADPAQAVGTQAK